MGINTKRLELQDEAFEACKEHNFYSWIILPTGSGKSALMVRILKHLKPKSICYMADNKELRDKDFPAEMKKWGAKSYIPKTTFVCYQTACKWSNEKFDLGLMDEGDFALTPQYIKAILKNKFKYLILVSATLDAEKRRLAEKIAPIAYEKHIGEVAGSGVVNKEQIWFVPYQLTKEENSKYLGYNESFRKLLNESRPNKFRLEQLQILRRHFLGTLESAKNTTIRLLKELYPNKDNKIIVFCTSNEMANKVCKYTYHTGSEKEGWLEKFENDKIRVIAVCGKIDRGKNISGVNNQIHVSPQRSKTKMLQKTGRGRRLDVDDTVDLYFLIPYFRDKYGNTKPTIVQDYVMTACKDMDLKNAKTYKFNE